MRSSELEMPQELFFSKVLIEMTTEVRSRRFWRDVIVEMVATFMLVSVQAALPLSWGNSDIMGGPVHVSLGMGFVVTCMAWTFGDLGGAHMNPVVTFAMMLRRKATILRFVLYVIVQLLGALGGAAFIFGVTPAAFRDRLAVTSLHEDVTPAQGVFIEAWITCILVLVIFGSTNSRRKRDLYMPTIPVGFAVALCIMAAFMSTGASMNPARSFGPAVVMSLWDDHWVYWVGPFLGSTVATAIYFAADVIDIDDVDSDAKAEQSFTDEKAQAIA